MAILDEVEHLLPLDRGQSNGDSGVSNSLQGMYQTFLADCLAQWSRGLAMVATSNRPFAISEAMRQRWVFLPVFSALREDLAGILKAMLAQLDVNDASPDVLIPKPLTYSISVQRRPRERCGKPMWLHARFGCTNSHNG